MLVSFFIYIFIDYECYGNVKKNKMNDNNNKDLICLV